MVIGSLPTMCARRYPKKTAIISQGKTRTFGEFNFRVNALLDSLNMRGLKKGDKVAVLSRNNSEVIEIMFACAKGGLVYVPINFRLAPPELKFVINDAQIQMLFVSDDFLDSVKQVEHEITCNKVFRLSAEYEGLVESGAGTEPHLEIEPSDLFAIFYTSGTTAGPKGVMLTHDSFLSAAVNHVIAYQLSAADVCCHVMPFYHTMEASMVVCHFYVGGANFIPDLFSGHEFWKDVKKYGITNITLVYTMLSDVLDAFEEGNYEKGTLQTLSAGGQSVPVDIIRRTHRVLGPDMLFQVYGLTEASPLLTYLPRTEMVLEGEDSRRLASIGKELFTCHVRVVDEEDHDVEPGEFGEIIARGPNVMQGYWHRPQETEEALRGGWLRTGDVATIDADGYIYIVDRKKDLIISGGENISPREVEEVIYQHPKVRECSVIGVPDERWGEQVRAIVVLRAGEELTEPELLSFCKDRLAKYKLPKSIVYVQDLPKDPVGKIQKRVLRDLYSAIE
jgi:long-chain acyl-CoA synthetase